jgi:hypothetical protein
MSETTFTPQNYDYVIKLELPEDQTQRANLIDFFDAMARERQAELDRQFRAALDFKPRERKGRCQSTAQ